MRKLDRFALEEDGAVTVDWVVLAAVVVAAVLGLFTVLTPAVYERAAAAIASDIQSAMDNF